MSRVTFSVLITIITAAVVLNAILGARVLDRSLTLIKIITVAVVLSTLLILRWKRHSLRMRFTCPSEILLLESVEERKRVCDLAYAAFLMSWRHWITFAIYVVALALVAVVVRELVITMTQAGQWSLAGARFNAFVPIICEGMTIPLMWVHYRKFMRSFLRAYLNDHGIPICENCGYDLRGQVNQRCPECGKGFEPKPSAASSEGHE